MNHREETNMTNRRASSYTTLTAIAGLLIAAATVHAENNSIVPLTVGPSDRGNLAPGSLSWSGMPRAGARIAAPAQRESQSGQSPQQLPAANYYALDLVNQNHNPVLVSAQSHAIYVNNPPSHWGDPATFLTDLGSSDYIHLVDQYTGTSANHRYTLGTSFSTTYTIPANHTLTTDDIASIVHAAAQTGGSGYSHIYHLFLPSGVDFCLNSSYCYSPDNDSTFFTCGYWGRTTFADSVGHVVFTVNPYQNIPGCSVLPSTAANSTLIDSTDTTLTYLMLGAITDPDGNGWIGFFLQASMGGSCQNYYLAPGVDPFVAPLSAYSFLYPKVKLNGHSYTIQPGYSNQFHGCAYTALPDQNQQ
jgi:hypothetical protein